MLNLSRRNAQARIKMKIWFHANFKPSQRLVAEAIDINYGTFKKFTTGDNLGKENLEKVEAFLDKEFGESKRIIRNQKAVEEKQLSLNL